MDKRTRIIAGCLTLSMCITAAIAQTAPGGGAGARPAVPPRISKEAGRTDGGTDARAIADPRIVALIVETKRRVPIGLDEAAARQLVAFVLEDRQVDMAEYDLLDELTQNKIRVISVSSSANPADSVIIGIQFGAVARILEACLDQHVEKFLTSPPTTAGWAQTLDLAEFSAASELRIRRLLTRQLQERQARSSVGNAYEPLSTLITQHFKAIEQLPAARVNAGAHFLWAACKDLDNATGDQAVPDFLYNWVRPKA